MAVTFVSAILPSCSCDDPEFVHMDFSDDINIVGPTMAERAAGNASIDSPKRSCDLFFLVNETNPKCYAPAAIHRFIDTNQFIKGEIAKHYHELRIHFYHRGDGTNALIKSRSTKELTLFDKDIISEYVWRDGQPRDTLSYENGQVKGAENIQLEDVRKEKKQQ